MGSFSATAKNKILDAVGNATAIGLSGALYAKLHIGDPGAAGTANAAANTTRQAISCAVAAAGAMVSDAEVRWNSVPNAETYTHISVWDANAAGVFVSSDDLPTSKTVGVGDNFYIASGDVSFSI